MIKVIKSPAEYEAALARLEELMARSPEPDSAEANQIELLGLLIEDYEAAHRPPPVLDAMEAILFRMDQLELQARDLIPFIGSRSKVSEVLARKRPLTLPMIRALHEGLGIPTDVLLRPTVTPSTAEVSRFSHSRSPGSAAAEASSHSAPESFPWERFPIPEMAKRGWIPGLSVASAKAARRTREAAAQALSAFFAPLGTSQVATALFRQANHVRGGRAMDSYALAAWTARVMAQAAAASQSRHTFEVRVFDDDDWIDAFVRLSRRDNGPQLAVDALAEVGIAVIVEEHLPRTQLDGAAFCLPNGGRVVGLTLRHDRTDNFWYTLCHELAHLTLHLAGETPPVGDQANSSPTVTWMSQGGNLSERFYDNLDTFEGIDSLERQADAWAGEILVPDAEWRASAVPYTPSPLAVAQLAEKIGVSDAIVAGKARFEYKNYRILSTLVGHGAVRRLFPNITWSE